MICWSVCVRRVYLFVSIRVGEDGWIMMICWSVSVRRVYLFVSISVAVSTGGCIFFFFSFLSASGQWLGLYQILLGGGGGGGEGGRGGGAVGCKPYVLFFFFLLNIFYQRPGSGWVCIKFWEGGGWGGGGGGGLFGCKPAPQGRKRKRVCCRCRGCMEDRSQR